ncbi:carbohydrate porin [Bradyrhizobium sp. AUGA SZCCT0222]|uniref:carbohydrate porin n=1 Tax=Bradyrhizobium sp. AUGA SZCCT0222 TaxID=2807668 RepID=UPI001BAE3530|nr:carbohydrate porin [Bradyrhizobium sp. AUGA SZCCT0222]MBR1271040.1 carbohydrate porin [Bradyrhizobium sp. AUGA SZCCT0222]
MGSYRQSLQHVLAGAAVGAMTLASPTLAADLSLKAPALKAVYSWTGFYVGGHVGYGAGSLGPGTNTEPLQGVFLPHSVTGLTGGYQAGYNRQLANKVVLGIEADVSFGSPVDIPRLAPVPFNSTIDYIATARGRVGYAMGTWMPYVTGGIAWGSTHINLNDTGVIIPPKRYLTHVGWTAGLGIEVAVGGNWTAKAEYNYVELARRTYDLTDVGLPRVNVDPNIHLFKLGLNYRLWETPPWAGPTPVDGRTALPEPKNWNVHGQTTVIAQAYPRMRSPYEGTNSLPGGGQGRQTWTADVFLGWRLWQDGEFYFNPELAQGFGLNSTLGLAGFSNGEAQKGGAPYPKYRPQRYVFRQTFGLGGEQEDVADGPMQLAGKRDIDRVTVTVGRFAVGDYFDGNSYAKDPRVDFMNWAMWSAAAYDFPADLPGFTRGAVVELNRKDWAIRAGLFQVPNAPNSDVLVFKSGGAVVEFEERHTIFDQPGKLRLGIFGNRGNTGSYRNALGIAAADPMLDINDVIVGIRRENTKYGFYINAEQQLIRDVGIFARASWNDGRNEILSFTDVDRSVSAGLSVKGSYWGRPSDTFGIGGAVNGLSSDHRDFLAAGGLGLLIGDGRLNYRNESIFETYYAFALDKNFTFTADYQLIANPAYNGDRGPVSIFSGRLHGEF